MDVVDEYYLIKTNIIKFNLHVMVAIKIKEINLYKKIIVFHNCMEIQKKLRIATFFNICFWLRLIN